MNSSVPIVESEPAGQTPTTAQALGVARVGPIATPRYAGLVTRAIGLVVDAALINLVAIIVGLGTALVLSLLHLPKSLHAAELALGGCVYILWSIGYFVAFWSSTGQTPGSRVMQVRVTHVSGAALKPRHALARCVGTVLAALPLFLGFLPILLTPRRRGLQDFLGRSVVVAAPGLSIAQVQRTRLGTPVAAGQRRPGPTPD